MKKNNKHLLKHLFYSLQCALDVGIEPEISFEIKTGNIIQKEIAKKKKII